MIALTLLVGGAVVLAGVLVLAFIAKSRRARIGAFALAVFGIALSELGVLAFVRADGAHHDALFEQRRRVCANVVEDIVHHQEWFRRGTQFPLGERAAALGAMPIG